MCSRLALFAFVQLLIAIIFCFQASEAKTQNLDELDLETIWDEQHLKNLVSVF